MAKDHHDFSKDKDTPDSIRQLLEQEPNPNRKSQQGLPAQSRRGAAESIEPDDADLILPFDDEVTDRAEIDIPIYGRGESRALPNEFHSKKDKNR